MPASDYLLYRRYYAKQPFGQWRSDYNAARVVQATVGGKLPELMPFWYDGGDTEEDYEELIAGAVVV